MHIHKIPFLNKINTSSHENIHINTYTALKNIQRMYVTFPSDDKK